MPSKLYGFARLAPFTFGALVILTALGLLIWETSYTSRPGPTSYYSHFSGVFFSCSLAFLALEFLLLASFRPKEPQKPWLRALFRYCSFSYWIVVTISGLASTIAYGFTPKADCIGIQVLIFLTGVAGTHTRLRWESSQQYKGFDGLSEPLAQDRNAQSATTPHRRELIGPKHRHRLGVVGKYVNRVFKFFHLVFSVLFIVGAINLARTYSFQNPGTLITTTFPDGSAVTINYNCTSTPSSNSSSLPTLWFTSSPAHGIVDFLGLQTVLAETYGRNSCSYDPPNFGWSSRMPASQSTSFDALEPLLDAIGRKEGEKIMVAWAAGANTALGHAIANPDTVKGLVLLDVASDGIEWLDMQRAQNWTDGQTLQYAREDLRGRTELAQLILAIGIPWGLMPVFFPYNSTGYFDAGLYPRYRSQSLKEDMWAMQYYALIEQTSDPIPDYLETQIVPEGMPTFAVMTYDASTDAASSAFYREQKLKLMDHIAGGNLTRPAVWCTDSDCSLSFPVAKWLWTANALASIGVV